MPSNELSSTIPHGRHGYSRSESLPAPSLAAIFSSKALALEAFRLLGMDRGPGAMKLAPAFFEKHPELYRNSTAGVIARGRAIRPPQTGSENSAPVLMPLDTRTLTKYTEMARWYFDVSMAAEGGSIL
jgi:hypothetical protein